MVRTILFIIQNALKSRSYESSVFGLIFMHLVINDLLTLFSHFFVEIPFKRGHVRRHSFLW